MKAKPFQPPADYHIHTALCKHAEGQPLDYRRVAADRHVPEIAITDHAPDPTGYDAEHRMDILQSATYRQWVENARGDGAPAVLLGIEADYYDGCVPFLSEWFREHPFDLVLGSVHFLDYDDLEDPDHLSIWDGADIHGVWRRYFEHLGAMADTGLYDIVSHLDLPKRNGDRPPDPVTREFALPVLDRIAAAGMAIEINTAGLRHPVQETYPSPLILSWACERAIPITFGSDSHTPNNVSVGFERAVEVAREAGYAQCARYRRRKRELIPLA